MSQTEEQARWGHYHSMPGTRDESFVWTGGDGRMWVGSVEWQQQINFCPLCGVKALVARDE